jgi:hypothetical protein
LSSRPTHTVKITDANPQIDWLNGAIVQRLIEAIEPRSVTVISATACNQTLSHVIPAILGVSRSRFADEDWMYVETYAIT